MKSLLLFLLSWLAVAGVNWGFYDQPEAGDCSEFTGLLASDGKVKAWGREFHELSTRYSRQPIARVERAAGPTLDWQRCIVSPAAGNTFREKYYRAWMNTPKDEASSGGTLP